MSNYRTQATQLESTLSLSQPPTAVAFCDTVPGGIANFEGTVAAGCAFWEKAARGTFATTVSDHEMCAIGIHTHNMADAPASQGDELQASLNAMVGLDYVREAEIAAIPVLETPVKNAVYGPLSEMPLEPNVVFLFAHAQQGLILSEAVERVDQGTPLAMGRPACAIVPQVVNHQRAALSLGCCGARAYLDGLSDAIALWALPGAKLDAYCEQIEILSSANAMLSKFHEQRRLAVELGERPSVEQTLQRLG